MYLRIIFYILAIVGLVIFQIAFLGNLPGVFSAINPVLIVLVFISGLGSFESALWWAAGAGLLLDIYSFNVFGLYLLGLLIVALFINFLQTSFFTNRSLYSFLAVTFFAVLGYDLIIRFIAGTAALMSGQSLSFFGAGYGFFADESWRMLANLFTVAVLFYLLHFVFAKFKPIFLLKYK